MEAIAITSMTEILWAIERAYKEIYSIKEKVNKNCSMKEKSKILQCEKVLEELVGNWKREKSRWT